MWFLKHSKIWDVTNLPPLKGISSPRFGEARKKDGFGYPGFRQLGGLPPLKETFVGSLELLFSSRAHIGRSWILAGSTFIFDCLSYASSSLFYRYSPDSFAPLVNLDRITSFMCVLHLCTYCSWLTRHSG